MPSRLRAADDHAALLLNTNHVLAITSSTGAPICVDADALPCPINVLLAPDLALSLSGICDRVKLPPKVVARSHIANHLVQYLRTNAAQLGLDYVSGIIHDSDQEDKKPKLVVRPGHLSLQLQRLPGCATLVELSLTYIWQTSSQQTVVNESPLTNPFSQNLSLPYQTLLNDVVERFVNRDLVKRYPLIFGPWRRQLQIETSLFPAIYRSIRSIADRSSNSAFKEKCDQLFMILRENMLSEAAVSAVSISNALPDGEFSGANMSVSELDALCLAMECLFQAGMQLPKYKGLNRGALPDRIDDEELSQKMPQCLPDGVEEPAQNALWELHSKDFLNNTGDIMDELPCSSYEYFFFEHNEPHLFQTEAYQNTITDDTGLGLSTDALAWDSDGDLWQDDSPSSVTNEISSSMVERLLDKKSNTANFKCGKGTYWRNGDITRPDANQGHLLQSPDLCEALMADDDINFYHPMGGWPPGMIGNDSGDELVFVKEEKGQDNTETNDWQPGYLWRFNQWAVENLFVNDDNFGTEGGQEAGGASSCNIHDHKILVLDDDMDLLSEGSIKSVLSFAGPNGDLDEDVTCNVVD